jgi:hypothetical protein
MFEKEFNKFLESQCKSASGLRQEQLQKDLTGIVSGIPFLQWTSHGI